MQPWLTRKNCSTTRANKAKKWIQENNLGQSLIFYVKNMASLDIKILKHLVSRSFQLFESHASVGRRRYF